MKNSMKYAVILLFIITGILQAQPLERSDVPENLKWNLEDLYTSKEGWEADKEAITKKMEVVTSYKGKLGLDAETLYNAMRTYFDVSKDFYKFYSYAARLSDQDLRVNENRALTQEAQQLATQFSESVAFFEPEILEIDEKTIQQFFEEQPKLEEFRMYIQDIQRLKKHTLSEAEEKIMASYGLITGTPSDVYGIFTNTEMPFAEVELSTGETARLTPAGYTRYRSTEVREDRAKIFSAFFGKYGEFINTITANFAGKIKGDWVRAKNRNYESCIEASLNGNKIPVSVYENLINQIHESLPTLHRYLQLKEKMLGLDEINYYDLYTPIVEKVELDFTVEEGQNVIKNALEPMGKDYISTLDKAFNNRWIDYMPTEGKRSGAYSSGAAYDVHPYILMNYNNDFESVSTLAHELGHTMHSYFSNTNQPFATSNYSIFVAEIASTFNETLLNDYMVKNAKSDEEKLYILGSYLELMRTTVFRQTLFAEFEWEVHKMVEAGQPLTSDAVNDLYLSLIHKYYGVDEGQCVVDDYIKYEWAYIPHFLHYNYYVYQYSTSLIYATAFAEKVIREGDSAVQDYYKLLKGGGSMYPIDLIKEAGIDPMSAEPFKLTMERMNKVMDQMEAIIAKK